MRNSWRKVKRFLHGSLETMILFAQRYLVTSARPFLSCFASSCSPSSYLYWFLPRLKTPGTISFRQWVRLALSFPFSWRASTPLQGLLLLRYLLPSLWATLTTSWLIIWQRLSIHGYSLLCLSSTHFLCHALLSALLRDITALQRTKLEHFRNHFAKDISSSIQDTLMASSWVSLKMSALFWLRKKNLSVSSRITKTWRWLT